MTTMSNFRRRAIHVAIACASVFGTSSSVLLAEEPAFGETPALEAWASVYQVLTSPRCRNCHPVGDAPLNGNLGLPHAMNVSRKSPEAGLPCTTCHREENGRDPGSPPGVPGWHMPPREQPMPFEKRTSRELCLQIQDPTKNGGRTLASLVEHVASDKLVLWAWNPGPGRARPPISHDELVAKTRTWVDAGGPCPAK
ncbi:MAG: cytochrome c3 family protein [Polyangiaceae bacterium]